MSELYSFASGQIYDRTAKTTKQFFAKVQNKMHYAVRGHTAAELIYERADADKPHMGHHMGSSTGNAFVRAYRLHIWIWQKIVQSAISL